MAVLLLCYDGVLKKYISPFGRGTKTRVPEWYLCEGLFFNEIYKKVVQDRQSLMALAHLDVPELHQTTSSVDKTQGQKGGNSEQHTRRHEEEGRGEAEVLRPQRTNHHG